MTNHPNRAKTKSAARNPRPAEIVAARERLQAAHQVGITEAQSACAEILHTTLRTWQQWEAPASSPSHRRMHPAFWELFEAKAKVER